MNFSKILFQIELFYFQLATNLSTGLLLYQFIGNVCSSY